MLVGAGLAVARGVRTLAARLIGAAPLADRSSFLGLLAGGPPRFYQWRR